MDKQIVVAQSPQLRAPETFVENYKPLNAADVRNLERAEYADFKKRLDTDPVKVMLEASDLGLDVEQYGNLISPETLVNQKRSIMHRVCEDEGIFVNRTDVSAPSTVAQCLENPLGQMVLGHLMAKVWDKNTPQDRNSITLQTSQPVGTPPNEDTDGMPPPIPIGLRLNPGELVANVHSIDTNSYSPFRWKYDRADMQRTKVKPAETIPASTLSEESGNIQMSKWGNRFVLPYEMMVGGQGMRINKLASMVALDAQTESVRMYAELISVLQNGDGVVGAATVEKITDYGTTEAKIALVPLINWLEDAMPEPFQISHVIMNVETQRQLRAAIAALQGDNVFQHLNSVGLGPNRMSNMDPTGSIRYGKAPKGTNDAGTQVNVLTANYVLGIDARYAIEKVNRSGLMIRQQAEQIANQTREVVISDTYLWSRLATDAVRVLNTGA